MQQQQIKRPSDYCDDYRLPYTKPKSLHTHPKRCLKHSPVTISPDHVIPSTILSFYA